MSCPGLPVILPFLINLLSGFFLAVGSSGLCAALLLLVLVYGLYSLYSKGRKKNEETRLILQPFDDPERAAIPDPVLVHQQLR